MIKCFVLSVKMNEIVNKFLPAGNKFMTEMHLKQHGVIYSDCDSDCKKRKLYSSFRDNIWGIDLADMQSLSKYDKGIKYLLCAIDIFGEYAWIVPLKDKKATSIVNAFQKIILEGSQIKYGLIEVVNFIIILLKIF